jgi:hypothetical protein
MPIIIKILLLSLTITKFTPLQTLLFIIKDNVIINHITEIIYNGIVKILSCFKCAAFWTGLIMTGDIWIALTASFIAYVYNKLIDPYIEKIRFI